MRTRILFFLTAFAVFSLSAQETDSVNYPNFKLDGSLKNKLEYATATNMSRFSVRNSRVGVAGNITSYAAYRVQVELSNEGKFSVLDLSGTLKPIEGLSLTLGQTSIPLFNSYIVSPAEMLFANRAFLGKYYLSTRDLGLIAKYGFNMGVVPTKIEFGVFNGNAINDPVWKKNMAYGGRLELGDVKRGLRFSAKAYDYPNTEEIHYLFYGADLRYKAESWQLETEVMKRDSKTESQEDLLSYYVQGAYEFPVKTKLFSMVKPAARWDAIDQNLTDKGFDVDRFTLGLGFGFEHQKFSSILRFDYEWYFVKNELPFLNKNDEMDSDKFTVELLFSF